MPHATVIPVALIGSRDMMQPSVHKFPRFWRRINITIGRGITWEEWLVHPNGAGLEDDEVVAMAAMSDDDLDANMAVLQRQFTDQLMASLKHLGAP